MLDGSAHAQRVRTHSNGRLPHIQWEFHIAHELLTLPQANSWRTMANGGLLSAMLSHCANVIAKICDQNGKCIIWCFGKFAVKSSKNFSLNILHARVHHICRWLQISLEITLATNGIYYALNYENNCIHTHLTLLLMHLKLDFVDTGTTSITYCMQRIG